MQIINENFFLRSSGLKCLKINFYEILRKFEKSLSSPPPRNILVGGGEPLTMNFGKLRGSLCTKNFNMHI